MAVCWDEKKITETRLRRVPSKQQTQQTPPKRRSAVFCVCVVVGGGGGGVVLDNLVVVLREYSVSSDVVNISGSFRVYLAKLLYYVEFLVRSRVKIRVELGG